MARKKYYVFVAELSEDALTQAVRGRNQNRDSEKPLVKVGFVANLPRRQFPDGDFSEASGALKRHGVKLLPKLGGANPYADGFNRRVGALAKTQRTIESLRSAGYAVYNRPFPANRRVYVIELDGDILEEKSPNSRYTSYDSGSVWKHNPIYVGETSKSREQRFSEHLQVRNSNVHPFATKLRLDLTDPMCDLTPLESLRAERSLAYRLGDLGYPVYGGH